jgi:hypothetical protein
MTSASQVGTGVIGVAVTGHGLDAGLDVLMIEAGPRVTQAQIVENDRTLPLDAKPGAKAPYPPADWAPHPFHRQDHLVSTGPDASPPTICAMRRLDMVLGGQELSSHPRGHAAEVALRGWARLGVRRPDAGSLRHHDRTGAGHL